MHLPTPEAQVLTVCGGKITNAEAYPSSMFEGKLVYFCTLACLAAFEADPEAFMNGEIEHPEN